MRIRVKGNSIRAVSFLPNGQQITTWLRAGEYQHKGIVIRKMSDMGRAYDAKTAMLISDRAEDRGPFYVRPDVAQCEGVETV